VRTVTLKMKLVVIAVFVTFGVLVNGRSIDQYTPEEENFALGVEANGHPLGESLEDEGGKTELDPMAQCLWDLLVCWNKREISSSKCGFIYSDCIEAAKKGKPSTDAPVTDLPPPPVPDE